MTCLPTGAHSNADSVADVAEWLAQVPVPLWQAILPGGGSWRAEGDFTDSLWGCVADKRAARVLEGEAGAVWPLIS